VVWCSWLAFTAPSPWSRYSSGTVARMPLRSCSSLAVGLSQFPLRLQPKLQIAAGRSTVDLPQLLGAGSDPFVGTSGGNALLRSLFQFLNASAIGRSFGRLRQKPGGLHARFRAPVREDLQSDPYVLSFVHDDQCPELFNSLSSARQEREAEAAWFSCRRFRRRISAKREPVGAYRNAQPQSLSARRL